VKRRRRRAEKPRKKAAHPAQGDLTSEQQEVSIHGIGKRHLLSWVSSRGKTGAEGDEEGFFSLRRGAGKIVHIVLQGEAEGLKGDNGAEGKKQVKRKNRSGCRDGKSGPFVRFDRVGGTPKRKDRGRSGRPDTSSK